jgi:hypothetical protein
MRWNRLEALFKSQSLTVAAQLYHYAEAIAPLRLITSFRVQVFEGFD